MMDLKRVQQQAYHLLDEVNKRWREFTIYEEYFDLRVVEFLLLMRKLGMQKSLNFKRILEVGCGLGCTLYLLGLFCDEVVGVDFQAELEKTKKFIDVFPPTCRKVSLVESTAEDLSCLTGSFDLVVTSYVLEHVDNLSLSLNNLKSFVARPSGIVIHTLNSLVDRHDRYVMYRMERSTLTRMRDSVAQVGLKATLRNPFGFTPPHEPKFGDFAVELREYRLERWAHRIFSCGYEILDYFQTRDNNWVFITRPLE